MQFSTRAMIRHAEQNGYAIPAVNVFDEFSMRGVITAAERCSSPFILQISTKTARNQGVGLITDMFRHLAGASEVPLALHLDHCPDRGVIDRDRRRLASRCSSTRPNSTWPPPSGRPPRWSPRRTPRASGWSPRSRTSSVLRTASARTRSSIRTASRCWPAWPSALAPTCWRRQLGTAHGLYTAAPELLYDRARAVREDYRPPHRAHGGTGLSPEEFTAFIDAGVSKINISTQCKIATAGRPRLPGRRRSRRSTLGSAGLLRLRGGGGRWPSRWPNFPLLAARPAGVRVGGVGMSALIFRLRRRAGRYRALRPPARLQPHLLPRSGCLGIWSEEVYGEKLKTGGGKERMATMLTPEFVASHGLPADEAGQAELLKDWHRRKTAHYTEMDRFRRGAGAARRGRLVDEARAAGWQLAGRVHLSGGVGAGRAGDGGRTRDRCRVPDLRRRPGAGQEAGPRTSTCSPCASWA